MSAGVTSQLPPYLRPDRLEDALAILAAEPRLVLAGGTDVYPAYTTRPIDRPVLDITAPAGAARRDRGRRRVADPRADDLDGPRGDADLPPAFDGLRAAARTIGGRQIQNAGTVCGNVVNASPAADGMPNLLALDAEVELASAAGSRVVPLAAFVLGNRVTDLRPGELVTGLRVPRIAGSARSTFAKLGSRAYLVISIVAVAVVVVVEDGVDRRCAGRGRGVLAGRPAAAGAGGGARRACRPTPPWRTSSRRGHLAGLAPLDDVRGTAAYREDAALTARPPRDRGGRGVTAIRVHRQPRRR